MSGRTGTVLAAVLLGGVGLGAFTTLGQVTQASQSTPVGQAGQAGQKIEALDVLSVKAMTLPDPAFTSTFQVDADGTITYPYIGKVNVRGKSPSDVGPLIGQALLDAKIVSKLPDISVSLAQSVVKQVQVSGAVRSPGSYDFGGRLTVFQALLKAQMFAPEAGTQVLLLRGGDPSTAADDVAQTLSRQEIENGGPAANVVLNDGDKLIVPSAKRVTIGGYVRSPNQYLIEPGTTVRQAIILAGGASEYGALNRVQVVRNGKPLDKVDLDKTIVQPGDTIMVPKRRM